MRKSVIKNHPLNGEKPILLGQDFSDLVEENRKLKRLVSRKETQLIALQDQISRLETLAAIGSNGATVAHELNNPLTVICAESEEILYLLEEEPVSGDGIKQSIQNVKNASHRMRSIINHFQARNGESGDNLWEKQDLVELIQKSIDLVKPQLKHRGIAVILDLEKELPDIWGNKSKLESILQNLLINAMDALSNTKETREKQIFISAKFKNRFIHIRIKDTGCGIPSNLRKQIFTPFFTTKKQHGTGLGLAIVARYLKEHHGQIHLNTDTKTGTEFILKFPLERRNGRANQGSDR